MNAALPSTPKAEGYRLAAEFEPHAGVWMLWPERADNWRAGAKPAQAAFAALAAALAPFERVTIGASPGQLANAGAMLPSTVRVVELASDDAWMRDMAPAFVVNDAGDVRGVKFGFNAWGGLKGGLYFPWDQDALVAAKLLEIEQLERYDAPLIAEGGALASDGLGTLITTVDCLINDNRNPGLRRARIEGILRDYLSASTVIWLDHGLPGDETGGHIDNLVAFVRPGVLVMAWTEDRADPFYDIARLTFERLAAATDARGRRFEIHKIHQPRPMIIRAEEADGILTVAGTKPRRAGDAICASYINACVGNGVVIVPSFDDPNDEAARAAYAALHPERRIIQVPAREVVLGGGGLHCITHEQPRV
ncbi:MAG: agmatine deiminase [Alphaproteobacteria bacterium]|nr:agmatine deiminase [Alphaproteobacteria bacterium]